MPTKDAWIQAIAQIVNAPTEPPPGFVCASEFAKACKLAHSTAKIRLDNAVKEGKMEIIKLKFNGRHTSFYRPLKKSTC